jgi:hypothetical protein
MFSRPPAPVVLSSLTLVLTLAACDAQNDGQYNGEPLLTLTGTVESHATTVPAGVDLVVAYLVPPADPDDSFCLFDAAAAFDAGQTPDLDCRFTNLAPERVEVTGQFPAAFQFTLNQPPPAGALVDTASGKAAMAEIFAVRRGSAGDLRLGDLVGYSRYFLAYTDAAVDAAKVCRQAQNGDLTCGPERIEPGFVLGKGLCGGQTVGPDTVCSVRVDDSQPISVELTDLETIVRQSLSNWTGT